MSIFVFFGLFGIASTVEGAVETIQEKMEKKRKINAIKSKYRRPKMRLEPFNERCKPYNV